MARKDSILRLHRRLLAKRDDLRGKLREDELSLDAAVARSSDVGEVAIGGEQQEISSRLASIESIELRQVEAAIESIRRGTYGNCDYCDRSIPFARLQALPFTTTCIECQRQQELSGLSAAEYQADWETAIEYEGRASDREITMSDIEIDS